MDPVLYDLERLYDDEERSEIRSSSEIGDYEVEIYYTKHYTMKLSADSHEEAIKLAEEYLNVGEGYYYLEEFKPACFDCSATAITSKFSGDYDE